MKQIIFFDLDGTLIDTSERHHRVYKDILEFYGIPNTLSKEKFWGEKRKGKKTVELLPETSSKEFVQTFMDEWLKRIENRKYLKYDYLLPGVLDVLSILKNKSDLILVTLRNNKENLFWELNNLGLIKYFKEILVDSPMKPKNKTLLIKNYIERHSRDDNFIIVGDTEVDISSGKELGILIIAVSWGIRSEDFLKKLTPNFCLDNLSELHKILQGIRGEL